MPELGKSITSYSTGAAAYDRMMQPWSQVYLPKLMRAVGIGVGERVLDVATGTGAAALVTADRVGPRGWVVGVDVSLPMRPFGRVGLAVLSRPEGFPLWGGVRGADRTSGFGAERASLGVFVGRWPRAKGTCSRVRGFAMSRSRTREHRFCLIPSRTTGRLWSQAADERDKSTWG